MSADLRRLADALGIAADYEDVWGRRHETGDPVRRALLGAMGIAADSDALIHDALVALEHDRVAAAHAAADSSCATALRYS